MFNICEKCKREISPIDEVACPTCDKKYHSWCWESETNCLGCHETTKNYVTENIHTLKKDELNSSKKYGPNSSGVFSNIGGKLKGLATFATVVGIIAGIIVCVAMAIIDLEMIPLGLVIGVAIALLSWIGSFVIYGFGELITTSQSILRELNEFKEK